jgi:GH24 family phage-related lysozyme (muramidase)
MSPISVTLPELCSALISVFEGCRLQAYRDTGGVWTIGYGHTGRDVNQDTKWTQQQADEQLAKDQAHLFQMVAGRPLLEAGALVSFGYNCGAGALARVLGGQASLDDFVHDRLGHTLPGLVSRRRLERTLAEIGKQL